MAQTRVFWQEHTMPQEEQKWIAPETNAEWNWVLKQGVFIVMKDFLHNLKYF